MNQHKYIFLSIVIMLMNVAWSQNTLKNYFFGSENFYKDNQELVIIVENPQTEFAENLGSRYYNDTTFLRIISTEFFTETDTTNHEQLFHLCGYDLYFYTKKNNNLFLFKAINSSCDMEELGIIDSKNKCQNLEVLATSGTILKVDTLQETVYAETKDSILKDVIFHRNVSMVEGNITSESFYYSGRNNSRNSPKWQYDYVTEILVPIDSSLSIDQNIKGYLASKGIDSVEYKMINWQIDPYSAEKIGLNDLFVSPVPEKIGIQFYLSKEYIGYFENEKLNCILPEKWTKFHDDSNRKILLFKLN